MSIRKCGNCGKPVENGDDYCGHCGTKYVETGKRCNNPKCKAYNKRVPLIKEYCGKCGTKLVEG